MISSTLYQCIKYSRSYSIISQYILKSVTFAVWLFFIKNNWFTKFSLQWIWLCTCKGWYVVVVCLRSEYESDGDIGGNGGGGISWFWWWSGVDDVWLLFLLVGVDQPFEY